MVVDVIRIAGLCHHDQPTIECQLHEALYTHRLNAFITWERGNAPSISALVPACPHRRIKIQHINVVVHLSDHNRVMVAQVDYHIRAEQSINGKDTTEYIHKVSMI